VLWRQCGGARWKLLLYRTSLQREAHRLRESL
jgi:CII-binding regulator of phage lambda lysogenization HflD